MDTLLKSAWRWISTSRYTRFLEEENGRLREENRGLLNSLLGTAGMAAIPAENRAAGCGHEAGAVMPPHRRRSWQQVGRMLEMEEARRARRGAANRGTGGLEFPPSTPTRAPGTMPMRTAGSADAGFSRRQQSTGEGPTAPPSEHLAGR